VVRMRTKRLWCWLAAAAAWGAAAAAAIRQATNVEVPRWRHGIKAEGVTRVKGCGDRRGGVSRTSRGRSEQVKGQEERITESASARVWGASESSRRGRERKRARQSGRECEGRKAAMADRRKKWTVGPPRTR